MIEILWDGVVYWTRPDNHPYVKEVRELIKNECTVYSIRKVEE